MKKTFGAGIGAALAAGALTLGAVSPANAALGAGWYVAVNNSAGYAQAYNPGGVNNQAYASVVRKVNGTNYRSTQGWRPTIATVSFSSGSPVSATAAVR
ncbi:hypothetical protein [Leucobacter komagatae]|uniref:Lactococcin 972 family bacteriocin n=1 Tax=Leucobacter komagatae TaxID=55969 RepID=A0A0D0I1I6_9MICO|nr:hypothetical protein [Leucobacter komagatae]KIP53601.1 hypothetical protein SD72_02845 [Leucobacter komagatae]